MLTTCFNYADAVNMKNKNTVVTQDLQIVFRTELAKICEAREDAVLAKYDIGRDEFQVSLKEHKKKGKIENIQADIFAMMERAVQGNIPDLKVAPQASRLFSKEGLLAVYLEMCELIAVRLWQKLDECKRNNPGFNSRDETHYKKAIRQLSIYDVKS